MNLRILGIDEAGRGPVIGSMFIAGVVVPQNDEEELRAKGIRDSKTIGSSPRAKEERAKLATYIESRYDSCCLEASAAEIDQALLTRGLNRLEQKKAREIIEALTFDRCILDGHNLFAPLIDERTEAINKADSIYTATAAASIVAKHYRDQSFIKYAQIHGETKGIAGGGYANAGTLRFLCKYYEQHHDFPSQYRRRFRWKAAEALLNNKPFS